LWQKFLFRAATIIVVLSSGDVWIFFEAIRTRRSIRRYTEKKIDDTIIKKILAAGMMTPLIGNEQPWHFVVVRDAQMRKEISKNHPNATMVAESPVAIVVCADRALERHPGFMQLDCAAATQNILLASTGLGWQVSGLVSIPAKTGCNCSAAFWEYRIPFFRFLFCPSAIRRKARKVNIGFTLSCVMQNAGSFSIMGMNSLF